MYYRDDVIKDRQITPKGVDTWDKLVAVAKKIKADREDRKKTRQVTRHVDS